MGRKIFMILGLGGAKAFPMAFGVFLARWVGAEFISAFVLLMSFVAAASSMPTLGSTPQIMRAAAVQESASFIVRTAFYSVLFAFLILAVSFAGTVVRQIVYTASSWPLFWTRTLETTSMLLGLVFFALGQAVYAYEKKYTLIGLWSLLIYGLSLLCGVTMAVLGWERFCISSYACSFLMCSLLLFVRSQQAYSHIWPPVIKHLSFREFSHALSTALSTSMFGIISLVSFFLLLKQTRESLTTIDAAIFAASFQLFQVGLFLPSALGTIVVPLFAERQSLSNLGREAKANSDIRRNYLLIGVSWFVFSCFTVKFVFALYGFEYTFASAAAVALMQFAVILASVQAFYIQLLVAKASFRRLAVMATLWLTAAIGTLKLLEPALINSASAICIGYGASLIFLIVGGERTAPP